MGSFFEREATSEPPVSEERSSCVSELATTWRSTVRYTRPCTASDLRGQISIHTYRRPGGGEEIGRERNGNIFYDVALMTGTGGDT